MLQLNSLDFPSKQSSVRSLEFDCLQAPALSARISQRSGRLSSRLADDSSQGSFDFDLSALSSTRQGSSSRQRSSRDPNLRGRPAASARRGIAGVGGSKKASKWSQYSVAVAQTPIQVEMHKDGRLMCSQILPKFVTPSASESPPLVAAPGTLDGRLRQH